ncbi:MAG: hypothetical protein QOD72_2309 [Acidimicrobiaceae bacterium]|nr:hypothetical protein [Acidimicrobiaceae bacterium]
MRRAAVRRIGAFTVVAQQDGTVASFPVTAAKRVPSAWTSCLVVAECLRNDDNAKVRQQARDVLARYLPDERAPRALAEAV